MVLPGLPEQPSLTPSEALQRFLDFVNAGALGGGGAGLMTAFPITDPGDGGTIEVTNSGSLSLTHVSGAETRILPNPTFVGQEIIMYFDVDLDAYGGSIAIDAASAVGAVDDVITFDAVGQCVTYYGVQVGGALRWRAERALNNEPALTE